MHTSYVTCILYLLDPLDLTHYIWCFGIDTDPVPKGDAPLEEPLVNEHGWGLSDPKDIVHVPGA